MAAPKNAAGAIAAAGDAKSAALARKRAQKTQLSAMIRKYTPEIKNALPAVMTPERFTRIVLSAVGSNPELATCTQESFAGAMLTAAAYGFEVNTPSGYAYLIPYRNGSRGVTECQFQIGYKGLLALAYRSGEIESVQTREVCANDEFSYCFGLHPDLRHVPALTDRGQVTHYYAVINLKSGGYLFEVMSIEDIAAHRDSYSKARSGPWVSNFDAMAKKTVLKRALKYAPMASEYFDAAAYDEKTIIRREDDDDAALIISDYEIDESTGEVIEAPEEKEA